MATKSKTKTNDFISALSLDIVQSSSSAPAGVFVVFPEGETRSRDGRPTECEHWKLNSDTGNALAQRLNQLPTDMVIDYEHQTLYKEKNGQPAPAAGWLKAGQFKYIDGIGLCNTSPSWTAKATQAITNREYRYKSPVITYDEEGNLTNVLNVAITNQPALLTLDELTALSSQLTQLEPDQLKNEKESSMNPLLKLVIAQLGLSETANSEDAAAALSAHLDKFNQAAADAKVEIDADKPLAALSTVFTNMHDAQGEPDPAKYVPLSTMTETVAALNAKIEVLEQNQVDPTADLLTAALSDGRLLPAQKDWAQSYAQKDPEGFKAYLANAPTIAALTQKQTDGKPDPTTGHKITALSVEQKEVADGMGISHADMLAQLNTQD